MVEDMVKEIGKNKYLKSILVCAVVLSTCAGFASAAETQNNLLKTDVYKTSKNGVKVTLYTSKPYKEPLVVNKKSDNEYVIYLPETVNAQTSRPTNKSSDIQSVDIKTQQGKKSYTKVLIKTSKAVEITPQVQTLANSTYKMTDNEYKNLMSHVSKKTVAPQLRAKAVTKPKTVVKIEKPILKSITKKVLKTQNKIEQPKVSKPIIKKQVQQTKPQVKVQTITRQVNQPKPQVKPI